jgi:hypothetical protein
MVEDRTTLRSGRTMTTVHGLQKGEPQIGLEGRDAAGLMHEAASQRIDFAVEAC